MQQTQSITRRPVRPTTPADLWRLAEQGRANGVRLFQECVSGERFATSASQPGTLYRLSAHACTCEGFTYAGRCQHHSLLLAELGWLPDVTDDTDPEPPASPALAERRARAEQARQRLAARAADPGAADRALAATNAARLARMAAGVSVAA